MNLRQGRQALQAISAFAMLISAGLACDVSQIGQSITATPGPAAPPSATGASQAASPTEASAGTATPMPTLDPKATPVSVHPCELVTPDEAAGAIGEPVQAPAEAGGGCVYVDSGVGQYVLSAFAVPANEAGPVIQGHVYLLTEYGARPSAGDLDNLQALSRQGDSSAVIEGLLTLAGKPADYTAGSVTQTGDRALWVSKVLGTVRQGFLLAARGDALAGVDIVVTSARDEVSVSEAARQVVLKMISRLPPRFVISMPTPISTATTDPTATAAASATLAASTTTPGAAVTQATTARPSATPAPAVTSRPVATGAATPTLKPPAFSEPILAGNSLSYGGNCGLSLLTFSVTVADPSLVSPVKSVSLFARVVDPATGAATAWNSLPMVGDARDVWLGTLNAETQLPGHENFQNALVEYYFSATNSNGDTAASPHYGVLSNRLAISACPTATP